MTEINDGGPAFPTGYEDENTYYSQKGGMSLRDWFAGMAMHGALSNPRAMQDIELYKSIPFRSFEMADAMLKAREEKK